MKVNKRGLFLTLETSEIMWNHKLFPPSLSSSLLFSLSFPISSSLPFSPLTTTYGAFSDSGTALGAMETGVQRAALCILGPPPLEVSQGY